ncbi:MAG: hypothetical protein COX19_07225 [Desulfobacterales bacterium CG23_combo_of_CG06-09_8_20_14_all_51_8]|nr:MAG: hypothetical protein COX19_07225 [Desulfobacterales bacterium CG23_combo_of_CG06-09_8_20_14_all_51_8]
MKRYIEWVLKWPKMVLALFFLVTLVLSAGIFRLEFDTSIATFMPKTDPEYQFNENAKKIYGDCDTFVILSITHKNLWQYGTFKQIDNLLTDMEAFIHFDSKREARRLVQLEQFLSGRSVTGADTRHHFEADPEFQRLVNRKMDSLGADSGVLSGWMKRKLMVAATAARDLKAREMIDEIISPLTMKDISGEDDMLESYRLIESDETGARRIPRTELEFQAFIDKLKRNPAFEKGIFATDAKGNITDLSMIIRFQNVADSDPIAREILEIVKSYPQLTITPQGEPIVYIWINNYMQQDLMRLVPLVMLVVIIIFFLNFKSLRGVVLPTLTLSMATVWILGLMGFLGFKITTVGISIPILMIAVGSSYAIHILNQYYQDYDLITREGKARGLVHAMEHISTTVFLAGLTTVFSFLTLATHPLSALREWGFFSALGIALAVWISASIIPAGLLLMPHPKNRSVADPRKHKQSLIIDRIIGWAVVGSTRHYKMVLAVVAGMMVLSVVGLLKLNVETELLSYF